ncbi:MAG: zf-HC2 domain-containing protein [Spirochaetes bacterium]|nr:zf-HC2 domain-containing protein [Spirochaetota bacterium]
MTCFNIRKFLWDYVDDELPEEEKEKVEKHLKTCRDCVKELKLLNQYKKRLSSLDEVKAPRDFLSKIHERLEQPSGFKKMIKTLFVPFRIKIPLELAGALITAIFIIVVLNPVQKSPMLEEERTVDMLSVKKKPASIVEKEDGSKLRLVSRSPRALKRDKDSDKLSEELSFAKEAEMIADDESPAEDSENIMDLILLVSEEEGKVKGDSVPTGKSAQSDSIGLSSSVDEKASGSSDNKRSVEKDEFIRKEKKSEAVKQEKVTASQLNVMMLQLTNITRKLKGRVVRQEYDKTKTRFQSVIIEVPSKNYSKLLKELNNLGKVQQNTPLAPSEIKSRKLIQNRIQFQQVK